MTVCIAAACNPDGHKIVMCTDQRVTSELAKSDNAFKYDPLVNGWTLMSAGDSAEISAMRRKIGQRLVDMDIDKEELDETNVVATLKGVLRERKDNLCDDYTSWHFGIPYQEFRKRGREELPPDAYRDAIVALEKVNLASQYILTGFVNGFPLMVMTDTKGGAHIRDGFVIIGSGEPLAHVAMMRREHHEINSLAETMYTVYEAKRFAEGDVLVGEGTSMVIANADGTHQMISEKGYETLKRLYKKFGPQKITNLPDIENPDLFIDLGGSVTAESIRELAERKTMNRSVEQPDQSK